MGAPWFYVVVRVHGLFINDGWLLEDWWLLVEFRLRSSTGCAQLVGCVASPAGEAALASQAGGYESSVCV